ncbi:hypothetical protein NL676_038581 [Syzygium grande]|nr:hypothetical protein NL676_038581 [Syzygium grande]
MSSLRSIARHPSICLIDSSTTLRELLQIHAHLLLNGLLNEPQFLGQFVAAVALRNPENLEHSSRVLDRCENPTMFGLNSMIRVHSKSPSLQKSFRYYNRIRRCGLSLDNYTFNFLVRACAQLPACGVGNRCTVLWVFGGILDRDVVCQTAMLSASAKYGDVAFAKQLFDEMPERETVAWNVMIAGYAQCGESREALNLFHEMQLEGVKVNEPSMVMKSRGVKKLLGCSVVEVDGEVHEFFVGDNSHQMYNEIKVMLGEIFRRLRLSGYMANTNPVLFDIEEEEKENALALHSEKIATAFGLIRLKKDVPIRIVKNLRICWDCHDFMKIVSRTFDREIVVRDNNRFHHFKGGGCSCRDYW